MRILLSNDDGVFAPGLAALRSAVAGMGEVMVVAPELPQSAASHAITLETPLTVRRVQLKGAERFEALCVDGRPADCVRLGLRGLLPHRPELVLSGINAGANVGINVFYSGTVAAAAEAAMCGVPAVAFSATVVNDGTDFQRVGHLCRGVLELLLDEGLAPGELINVNIPLLEPGRPKGVRLVRQSTAELEDEYHRDVDHAGRETYRLGQEYGFAPGRNDTDVVCLAEGYVTITPLHVDMTDHKRLSGLERRQWENLQL